MSLALTQRAKIELNVSVSLGSWVGSFKIVSAKTDINVQVVQLNVRRNRIVLKRTLADGQNTARVEQTKVIKHLIRSTAI